MGRSRPYYEAAEGSLIGMPQRFSHIRFDVRDDAIVTIQDGRIDHHHFDSDTNPRAILSRRRFANFDRAVRSGEP